ncbi:MAG: dockerin type I repeat-containing protein [Clostridia bacterium]|nr:dockerin type I repeat-containing protein [Clostridia bacterium]
MFQVTSIGNLVGTALPSNRTKADVFYDFLLVNLDNARTYSGKTDQQIVDTLVNGLELTTEKAIELIALSGVYVDWTPEGAASDDEFTPATDDEFKPATKDEATTEDELDDCTESFLLGDANMDGNVNIKDATYIQKAVAGLIMMTELENIAADADCSDDINIKDATTIQKHLAGMEIGYPLGVPMCYHAESNITHVITPETN